jgi:hypothetical protein
MFFLKEKPHPPKTYLPRTSPREIPYSKCFRKAVPTKKKEKEH